jgi:hypothetical protein
MLEEGHYHKLHGTHVVLEVMKLKFWSGAKLLTMAVDGTDLST